MYGSLQTGVSMDTLDTTSRTGLLIRPHTSKGVKLYNNDWIYNNAKVKAQNGDIS
jgi:hypothetical protein